MKTSFDNIRDLIISNLSEIKELNNKIDRINLEKHDQFLDLINGIIEAIDTFEKAEEAIIERRLNQTEDCQKIISRYNSVKIRLLKLLQKNGISKIEFPEKKLIVGYCKVIDTEPDPGNSNDSIITVIRNGYIRGKELIREAEIVIVKN